MPAFFWDFVDGVRGFAEGGFLGVALAAVSGDLLRGEGWADQIAFIHDFRGWRDGTGGSRGVFGDFFDHAAAGGIEADAAGVDDRDVEAFEHELGAFQVDGVAGEGVEDFHDGGLDGFFVFDEGDGMQARLRRGADTANHALMEVAELFAAKSGRAALDTGDFDVGADFNVLANWHIDISGGVWIPLS